MDETRLDTIEQIEQFLSASAPIEFSTSGETNATENGHSKPKLSIKRRKVMDK